MVLKIYLFSQVSGNYQQYAVDHSETFLKQFCKNCFALNQIAIHRDGNLMYYAYAYRKTKSEIYGVCIVCGEICLNLQWLYEYFQKVLEASAYKGVLFCFDEHGKIRKNVEKFSSEAAEVDSLFCEIKGYVNKWQSYWEVLPSEDFSIPIESKISFAFDEEAKDKITDAIRHYHNVIVTMKNTAPSSFAKTIERLNSEKVQLQKERETLKNSIESLSKQKKQYRWVIVLSMLVVAGLIAILLFNRNVNELRNELMKREYSVDSLRSVVTNRDSVIYTQKKDLKHTQSILDTFALYMPILVSDMEVKNGNENYGGRIYSDRTTYIHPKLTVYSLIDGIVNLYVKFYTPNGLLTSSKADMSLTGYSYKDNVVLNKNQSTTVYLLGWGGDDRGHWNKGAYRIEVWYNNACIKAKTFYIY